MITTLLETFFAGFVGTCLMTISMAVIQLTRWTNADMVRALGSFVTRSMENALRWGLVIHFSAGMVFAIPYSVVLGAFDRAGPASTLSLGLMLGLAHGLVMSLILLAIVAEKHPLERFRDVGFTVAVAHILGHVAYGIGVGGCVGLLDIGWGVTI